MQETIDPEKIPHKILYNGDKIPAIGLGTFGSDNISNKKIADSVLDAIEIGYRHFDCASVYGNEKEIGQSLIKVIDQSIDREKLWITSKLWNDSHDAVINSCEKSLRHLGLDYLDLYLIHWPFPNFHPPKCDVESRSPNAKPYIHENFMRTWNEMEKLVEKGWVRNIGTSNVTIPKLKLILQDAKIKPAINEMELHPHFQQPELFDFVVNNQIVPVGYCPIGSPARPERDRTTNDTVDIKDPIIMEIAKNHEINPASLCVKWAEQRGQVPIPFSTNKNNILSNIKCLTSPPLTDSEMDQVASIDKKCRLIKGQVFLWKGANDWRDLWDNSGKINNS